jgi:tetratricopeptide (TPR) repeat protein
MRTGNGQRWAFPWLCVNDPKVRYKRAVHNILDFPAGYGCVKFPQIVTLHERVVERSAARAEQRQVQNRTHLMEDWVINQNENSLFYLGQEIRMEDPERAIGYLIKFLFGKKPSKVGPSRYQARLMLAKLYAQKGDREKTWEILMGATADDWSRTEHWLWLGDMAFETKQYDQALQFYGYLGTTIGKPPFTLWWIDLSMYGFLAAQRLAMAHAEVGGYSDSLYWAEKVLDLLPEDSPDEAIEEARTNIAYLKEAVENEPVS